MGACCFGIPARTRAYGHDEPFVPVGVHVALRSNQLGSSSGVRLGPVVKSACSFISAAYNLLVPLARFARFVRFVGFARFVRIVRFAHLAAKTFFLLHPLLQLGIVLIVANCAFVVYMSPLGVVARTLFRSYPAACGLNLCFGSSRAFRFARCANTIQVARSFDQFYVYVVIFLIYLFAVATSRCVAKVLVSLHTKFCSTLKAMHAAYPGTGDDRRDQASVPVPLSHEYVDLLQLAPRSTARRQARKAAKAAAAQAPVAPIRRSVRLAKKA